MRPVILEQGRRNLNQQAPTRNPRVTRCFRFLAGVLTLLASGVSYGQQWQVYATGTVDGTTFAADSRLIRREGSVARMWSLITPPSGATQAGSPYATAQALYYYDCGSGRYDSDGTMFFDDRRQMVYQIASRSERQWQPVVVGSVAATAYKLACGQDVVAKSSSTTVVDRDDTYELVIDDDSTTFSGSRFEAVTFTTYVAAKTDVMSGKQYSVLGNRVEGDCATSVLGTKFRRLFDGATLVREIVSESEGQRRYESGTIGLAVLTKICAPRGYSITARKVEGNGATAAAHSSSSGSAFLVSPFGHLLTNAHVVEGCSSITATSSDGREFRGAVTARDERNDLAVVKVSSTAGSALAFRQSPVRAGEQVVALGYPLRGLLATEANVSTGTVSALAGIKNDSSKMQIQAPVQPGNSGGPLMDLTGAVVGIVVEKLDALAVAKVSGDIPQNINFAVKGELAVLFLRSAGIDPRMSQGALRQDASEVAARSKPTTFLIECKQ